MSESTSPSGRPDCIFELDDIQQYDVEVVPCPDAFAKLKARRATETITVDSMLTEFTDTQIVPGDNPGRPAA